MASQALPTRHWGLHSGAQEKGTLSFESSIFHLHDEKSEHEHGHTSTSEYDLYLRPARPISVSAVPFGPGIDFWRSCRFIGALMRSLCLLPGGLGRFAHCSIGANHCRLRHTGWEKCSHGLTSRPRESASLHFLDELLALFSVPCWFWTCVACWHSSPSVLCCSVCLYDPLLAVTSSWFC